MLTYKKRKTLERIFIEKEEFLEFENQIRINEHLRRYAAIRRFCYGKVLDFACGCGYGSALVSVNPDVEKVVGIDIDKEAIDWANKEFAADKITFLNQDVNEVTENFDTLICLETIEHLPDLSIVTKLVERCDIKQIIVSFPDKKSTHFNKFHYHDFVIQDLLDLFPGYVNYYRFRTGDVQFLMLIQLPKNAPAHIFRYISDL
ncbi:MAG: class I SAM-dependent methyltransferase [Bacteroidota bacterium]